MRKIKYVILFCLVLILTLSGAWRYKGNFLSTAIDVNASATATNGTEFNSRELNVRAISQGALTATFTRAAGAGDTVDFAFEASYDNGANWATFRGVIIEIPTNQAVISGTTVTVLIFVRLQGVSHLRLKTVTNNDGANNLTDINVMLSY